MSRYERIPDTMRNERFLFIIDALKGHLETAISTLGMCSECGETEHTKTCGLLATLKTAERLLDE